MNENSSSISVIILTYNEEIHIERCIKSLTPFVKEIFIIDSFSTDRTEKIASSLGAKVFRNKWINYAKQFQWGLDNCPIKTKWVMRMDADEYVEPALSNVIVKRMEGFDRSVTGIYLKRKVFFMDKWIKWGAFYPHLLLRIWQHEYGRIEQRWMDEHVVLSGGSTTLISDGDIVDDNKNDITWWIQKHNNYATREMIDLMNIQYKFFSKDDGLVNTGDLQAKRKRQIKEKIYSLLPLGIRPFLYFMYRYFLRMGFLDGYRGFYWHFMQGFWYRVLVDIKCSEFKKIVARSDDSVKILMYKKYGIEIDKR